MSAIIEGRNAVAEALRAGVPLERILLADGAEGEPVGIVTTLDNFWLLYRIAAEFLRVFVVMDLERGQSEINRIWPERPAQPDVARARFFGTKPSSLGRRGGLER